MAVKPKKKVAKKAALKKVAKKSLAQTHPKLAKQADGWDPKTTTAGSGIKRNWKCSKGHRWAEKPLNRTHARSGNLLGCPTCSGHKILKGFNDLKTTHPKLAREAAGWDPALIGFGSHKKLDWKCNKGHVYSAIISNRLRGDGCQYCSGRQCLTGFNDLKTTDPQLAKQAFGWDPKVVSRGSGKKLKWKCSLGHTWLAKPNTRTTSNNNASGCPGCEQTGFNPERKAWLYLLKHEDTKLLQIGITNSPKSRLIKHGQFGWRVIGTTEPMSGKKIKALETKILKHLRSSGALFANKANFEKFDGYTESWVAESFPVRSIKQLMNLVEGDEK